ncbi:MAG TPA: prenyltransferase/squalene oxidase repeat-containing protein [Solirubrobacterales bacterium]
MRRLAAILALCSLLAAGSVAAGAPTPANQARLDRTVRYLQEAQNLDGGFGGDSGKESGQGFSAWVALSLEAAGINPQCQAKPGGTDAYSFLVDHFPRGLEEEISYPQIPTTAFERELMVVNAAGTDPHSFAGYDLVGEILARAREDNGSFPYVPGGRGEINDTIFAIVALAPVQEPAAQAAVQRAADWLIDEQDDSGGWSFEVKGGRTEADMTGAAIQALRAAGRPGTEAEQKGLQYLRDMQNPDGGFPEFPGESESNVASTAWAVQGIWAVGQDPETWVKGGGNEPLSYMASLQQPDGHIRWKAGQDLNGVWMTAYAAPAFNGQIWPIPGAPCSPEQWAASSQSGQGEGSQAGSGVIAGGGGRGAPLFSRPKPQSKGKTPGGARVVHGQSGRPIDHSKTRRGENTEQPTDTASAEPDREYDAGEITAVSAGSGGGGSSGGSASASAGEKVAGAGSGEAGSPAAQALSTRSRSSRKGNGREVAGTLVGASAGSPPQGTLAFGAPGLHSAGVSSDGTPWPAIAIGAAVVLFGFAGTQLERRRGELFA